MAVSACEECGKDRSDKARVCPHCGHRRPSRLGRKLLIAAGIAVVLLGVMGWLGSSPDAQERSSARAAIGVCWDMHKQAQLTGRAPEAAAQACVEMERKFEQKWNRRP